MVIMRVYDDDEAGDYDNTNRAASKTYRRAYLSIIISSMCRQSSKPKTNL